MPDDNNNTSYLKELVPKNLNVVLLVTENESNKIHRRNTNIYLNKIPDVVQETNLYSNLYTNDNSSISNESKTTRNNIIIKCPLLFWILSILILIIIFIILVRLNIFIVEQIDNINTQVNIKKKFLINPKDKELLQILEKNNVPVEILLEEISKSPYYNKFLQTKNQSYEISFDDFFYVDQNNKPASDNTDNVKVSSRRRRMVETNIALPDKSIIQIEKQNENNNKTLTIIKYKDCNIHEGNCTYNLPSEKPRNNLYVNSSNSNEDKQSISKTPEPQKKSKNRAEKCINDGECSTYYALYGGNLGMLGCF